MSKLSERELDTIYEELKFKTKLKERVLTHEEEEIVRGVLDQQKDNLMTTAILGLLSTGLRASEFVHLERNDIDFINKKLTIKPKECDCPHCRRKLEKYWKKKQYSTKIKKSAYKSAKVRKTARIKGVWTAKSSSSYRKIDLNDEALYLFKKIFNKLNKILDLYDSIDSLTYHVSKINKILEKKYKNFKIITCHSLRATKLTRVAEKTGDIFAVQKVAGHETTEPSQHYINITEL
ncbi:MAG TPA: tyrosine-type recombinase/integrase [Candidatus Bathyarchaeia archaeon]|nr:tyrosine-type recombinase/integrase [Candidatus Bathyarchaeia archaeon]